MNTFPASLLDDLCELVDEQLSNFAAWDGWLGNVGGGLGCSASLQELSAICRNVTGRQVDIQPDPVDRPADLRLFLADCRRLFERTAWRPCRNPERIVTNIFNWVRAHEAELKPLV